MPTPLPESRPAPRLAALLLPAIATTFLVGCTFATLKFVLIGRIGLDFDPSDPGTLGQIPWQWLRDLVLNAHQRGDLKEALSQALSAALTLGLIVGFPTNAPLADAWPCRRLFLASSLVVGGGIMMALRFNPWLWAVAIGVAYGAACAARGKIVPLIARAAGGSGTLVSGSVNAALAFGLVAGTVLGSFISEKIDSHATEHLLAATLAVLAMASTWLIRVPEPAPQPFAEGLRTVVRATAVLTRKEWPLLAGGGLAWGITAAASLAMYVHAVDDLHLPRSQASLLAGMAVLGAILGNLVSHRGERRRWVVMAFLGLAGLLAAYPWLARDLLSACALVCAIGFLFAAPANVLDARFLANAHEDGLAGLGGTVMSLMHSLAILAISLALAVPLFLGVMHAKQQFPVLAGIAILACLATAWARIGRDATRKPG